MKNDIPTKTTLQNWKRIKTFTDKQKLRESVTSRPVPQAILKGIFQAEMRGH